MWWSSSSLCSEALLASSAGAANDGDRCIGTSTDSPLLWGREGMFYFLMLQQFLIALSLSNSGQQHHLCYYLPLSARDTRRQPLCHVIRLCSRDGEITMDSTYDSMYTYPCIDIICAIDISRSYDYGYSLHPSLKSKIALQWYHVRRSSGPAHSGSHRKKLQVSRARVMVETRRSHKVDLCIVVSLVTETGVAQPPLRN